MDIKVSIIVPVYNVEKYLRQCLDSILNQNFDSYEIIIVNDGSTDKSNIIIEEYQSLYKNIKVLYKSNGGLSSARNAGLEVAIGKYVVFIDSDDIIGKDFILDLYKEAEKYELDVVFGSHVKFYGENIEALEEVIRKNDIYNSKIFTGVEMLYSNLINDDFKPEVWDDIYNRKFLERENLKFINDIYHEDEEFTTRVMLKAKRVKYFDSHNYYYRQRISSIMNNDKNIEKRIFSLIHISNLFNDYFYKANSKMERFTLYIRSLNIFNRAVGMISEVDNSNELIKEINERINMNFWTKNAFSLQDKIKGILIAKNLLIYVKLIDLKLKIK